MKTAVVTGGTTRLGLAISERLAKDGWRVITSSHRPDSGADIIVDLADPMGPAKLYAEVMKLLDGQPPDALVNNAALFVGGKDELDAINLTAAKKLTRMMAGRETTGRGVIVNILDTRVLGGVLAKNDYERTKAALLDFTLDSAVTYSDTIRVNAVAPGPVLAPTGVHEKAGEMPVERPTPKDVASAVAYLVSASSVTGCVIPVDGGQHLLRGEEE